MIGLLIICALVAFVLGLLTAAKALFWIAVVLVVLALLGFTRTA